MPTIDHRGEEVFSLTEAVELAMAQLGWSRERAYTEIFAAMKSGELPYEVIHDAPAAVQ